MMSVEFRPINHSLVVLNENWMILWVCSCCLSGSRSRPGGVEEEGGEWSERAVVLHPQRGPEDESRHPGGPTETHRWPAARSGPSTEVRHTSFLTCFSFISQKTSLGYWTQMWLLLLSYGQRTEMWNDYGEHSSVDLMRRVWGHIPLVSLFWSEMWTVSACEIEIFIVFVSSLWNSVTIEVSTYSPAGVIVNTDAVNKSLSHHHIHICVRDHRSIHLIKLFINAFIALNEQMIVFLSIPYGRTRNTNSKPLMKIIFDINLYDFIKHKRRK